MTKMFGVNISGLVAKHIGPGVFPATLVQVSSKVRTTGNLTGGTNPAENKVAGRGFIDTYEASEIDGTIVKATDAKIMLIADTFSGLPVPSKNDKVEIEGSTYLVINVKRDPASAAYLCQSRK